MRETNIKDIEKVSNPGKSQGSIKERLVKLVCKSFDIKDSDSIIESTSFSADLKADSLSLVELIMGIEEEFGIEISDKEAANIKTIGDAIKYIEDFIEEKK